MLGISAYHLSSESTTGVIYDQRERERKGPRNFLIGQYFYRNDLIALKTMVDK